MKGHRLTPEQIQARIAALPQDEESLCFKFVYGSWYAHWLGMDGKRVWCCLGTDPDGQVARLAERARTYRRAEPPPEKACGHETLQLWCASCVEQATREMAWGRRA